MARLKLEILKPGMFTTIQDLGRRGYLKQGVPVAGAMDSAALRLGNVLVGNEEGCAGLEITVVGPAFTVLEGEGCFAVCGAEVGIIKNGLPVACWTAHRVYAGDSISFSPPTAGVRAYLCVSGGIETPLMMGSRSTYTRGDFGGHEGRALKTGDVLSAGSPDVLWEACEGFECPLSLRPDRNPNAPLRAVPGPQDDSFTEEGLDAFFSSEYVVTNLADRMGYRMEGPRITHMDGADIVSDATCLGSVQVPGDGQPIVLMTDRQTTGGYAKIATICAADVGNLAQRMPGNKVRFVRATVTEAVELLKREAESLAEVKRLRSAWRSRPIAESRSAQRGLWSITVNGGKTFRVEWEKV